MALLFEVFHLYWDKGCWYEDIRSSPPLCWGSLDGFRMFDKRNNKQQKQLKQAWLIGEQSLYRQREGHQYWTLNEAWDYGSLGFGFWEEMDLR